MKNAYKILLTLDMFAAARSIGLRPPSSLPLLTEENLFQIINEIELALLDGDKDRQISSVCGLLWTHFHKTFDNLAEYIFNTMAKIGFSPVKSMLTDRQHQRISSSSVFSMLETVTQMQKESLTVFGKKYHLTRFQKNLWDQLERKSHVAVSAPTSAGKSFLICLNLLHGTSKRGGTSIFIVPTLTLMNQVAHDLIKLAREHQQDVQVRTHLSEVDNISKSTIFVVTQERLADHQRLIDQIKQVNFLIVDEVQNIERAFDAQTGDTRAKLLFDVIVDIHDKFLPSKTVILGPRINEVSELGSQLFGRECTSVVANDSPVTNLCYAVSPAGEGYISLTQYSELTKEHESRTFENTIGALGFGKSIYKEEYFEYLNSVLRNNDASLVFSPTSNQARKTALTLSGSRPPSDDKGIVSLALYISSTVSANYDLATCISKGVAYHHGKIPHHVRNALELAIVQGKLPIVACTTTLMQGVNIPAKNVFLRNPNLFVKKQDGQAPKLSGYEIANLRGRAGRLLRDFVGRTFILDGTSFQEMSEQQSLFEPPTKELDGSYAEVFQRERREIVGSLVKSVSKRGTLAKYICNILYTDAGGAATLLRKGIALSDAELMAIKLNQRRLSVPKHICKSHRFWDPFDLQLLQDTFSGITLPTTPFTPGAARLLESILINMFKVLPTEVAHYLQTSEKKINDKLLQMLAISAIEWATEKPLIDLLAKDFAQQSSTNTELAIATLQNKVSFGLPALLSPIYSMFAPESMLLAAIESGAYQKSSIIQINNNVPRETAIAVSKRAAIDGEVLHTMPEILDYLRRTKVSYWSSIQFRHLIDIEEIQRVA